VNGKQILEKNVEQNRIHLNLTFCRHYETADFSYITVANQPMNKQPTKHI